MSHTARERLPAIPTSPRARGNVTHRPGLDVDGESDFGFPRLPTPTMDRGAVDLSLPLSPHKSQLSGLTASKNLLASKQLLALDFVRTGSQKTVSEQKTDIRKGRKASFSKTFDECLSLIDNLVGEAGYIHFGL